jgi:hypothetical protein
MELSNRQGTVNNKPVTYRNNSVIGNTQNLTRNLRTEVISQNSDKFDGVTITSTIKKNEKDINNNKTNESYSRTNNNRKYHYNSSFLNYYWPLDPSHNLHPVEFLEEIRKRKQNYNPWKETKTTSYKTIQISTVYKEDQENKRKATKWKKSHLDKINISKDFYGQTKQQYNERVETGVYYPSMSDLQKRVPRAPLLDRLGGGGTPDDDSSGWTTVNIKKV